MRILLYVILSACLILIAGIYIFIPSEIKVSKVEEVESSERIINQFFNNSINRKKWWPSGNIASDNKISDSSIVYIDDYNFEFKNPHYNFNEVLISNRSFKTNSIITWESSDRSMIKISWRTSITSGYNPVKRFLQYQKARKIKAHMVLIMDRFLGFIIKSENVYGFKFERQIVKDTILATSSIESNSYPKIPEVYNLINKVQSYATKQNARQVNPPMLNIIQTGQGRFYTMIAVPINQEIKPDSDVSINRMIAGNILVAQVKGGPHTILKGFDQMKLYMNDFKLISPAKPFESLVTNRSTEPDTSRWVTKIYHPIF